MHGDNMYLPPIIIGSNIIDGHPNPAEQTQIKHKFGEDAGEVKEDSKSTWIIANKAKILASKDGELL